ncbi:MAG: hypothetical protein GMKNLPBB_01875 [Myxococcota bacterium]|nr:hypothetical protein [Myxococcota bacterium]
MTCCPASKASRMSALNASPNSRARGLAVALVLAMGAVSCVSETAGLRKGLTSIAFVLDGETGTEARPLETGGKPRFFSISLQALDERKQPLPVNRKVLITARGGVLTGSDGKAVESLTVELKDGVARGVQAGLVQAFGKCFIWAEELGEGQDAAGYAVGVSPPIYFPNPRIRDVQESVSGESPLLDRRISITSGTMVVTRVTVDGMFVTDLEEPEGRWASIFVFNFNSPEDVERGMLLRRLEGTVFEFGGISTQLTNPAWEVSETRAPEPPPHVITSPELASRDALEAFEGGLVRVENVRGFAPEMEDYNRYKQWPVKLDGGQGETIKIISDGTVRNFDPSTQAERKFVSITGNLRQIPRGQGRYPTRWVLLVRDSGDLPLQER